MTQEDKKLLLTDLCARLPYEVEVYYSETVPISTLKTINSEKRTCIVYDHSQWYRHSKFHIEEIKPYLRPMSSMTEEERDELEILCDSMSIDDEGNADIYIAILKNYNPILFNTKVIDWFNSHHFDYRGLIEKGLAIEVTKENNPYKEE